MRRRGAGTDRPRTRINDPHSRRIPLLLVFPPGAIVGTEPSGSSHRIVGSGGLRMFPRWAAFAVVLGLACTPPFRLPPAIRLRRMGSSPGSANIGSITANSR